MPPLPVDAPQEVADVEGATLDPEDVDETEVEDSDEENPPTPGRHQLESSSSRRAPSPPPAAARSGESPAPIAGTVRASAILIDDDEEGGCLTRTLPLVPKPSEVSPEQLFALEPASLILSFPFTTLDCRAIPS